MTDAGPRVHSSAAEVTRALLDITPPNEKFSVSVDGKGRVVASWFLANMGSSEKLEQYRITLLGETGEFSAWQYELQRPNTHGNGQLFPSYSYTFHSKDLTDPVDEVLAAHGWVQHRSGFRKFVERLFGRG